MDSIFNGLNDAVKAAAIRAKVPRFEARDIAPQSFEDMLKTYRETSRLIVWSGGSESTIYRDASVNYLFRAWHDWMHIQTGGDFSGSGEERVCRAQMAQVGTDFSHIVYLEIVGQAEHYLKTGQFPDDQVSFTIQGLQTLKIPRNF